MTLGMVVGLILLPLALLVLAGANKAHRDETGVNAPSRNAWRNIRRNARKKGINEEQAYAEWLSRQQRRRTPPALPPNTDFRYSATPPKPKSTATPKEIAQEEADEPLRAYAAVRDLTLCRQFDGQYYFLNQDDTPSTLVRNPNDPSSFNFSREEVIRFLGQLPARDQRFVVAIVHTRRSSR
jgi:hypothetical protein